MSELLDFYFSSLDPTSYNNQLIEMNYPAVDNEGYSTYSCWCFQLWYPFTPIFM